VFDVCVRVCVLFLIFAIIGTQSFKGDMRLRCIDDNMNVADVKTSSTFGGY
jgi:hypothetical protein